MPNSFGKLVSTAQANKGKKGKPSYADLFRRYKKMFTKVKSKNSHWYHFLNHSKDEENAKKEASKYYHRAARNDPKRPQIHRAAHAAYLSVFGSEPIRDPQNINVPVKDAKAQGNGKGGKAKGSGGIKGGKGKNAGVLHAHTVKLNKMKPEKKLDKIDSFAGILYKPSLPESHQVNESYWNFKTFVSAMNELNEKPWGELGGKPGKFLGPGLELGSKSGIATDEHRKNPEIEKEVEGIRGISKGKNEGKGGALAEGEKIGSTILSSAGFGAAGAGVTRLLEHFNVNGAAGASTTLMAGVNFAMQLHEGKSFGEAAYEASGFENMAKGINEMGKGGDIMSQYVGHGNHWSCVNVGKLTRGAMTITGLAMIVDGLSDFLAGIIQLLEIIAGLMFVIAAVFFVIGAVLAIFGVGEFFLGAATFLVETAGDIYEFADDISPIPPFLKHLRAGLLSVAWLLSLSDPQAEEYVGAKAREAWEEFALTYAAGMGAKLGSKGVNGIKRHHGGHEEGGEPKRPSTKKKRPGFKHKTKKGGKKKVGNESKKKSLLGKALKTTSKAVFGEVPKNLKLKTIKKSIHEQHESLQKSKKMRENIHKEQKAVREERQSKKTVKKETDELIKHQAKAQEHHDNIKESETKKKKLRQEQETGRQGIKKIRQEEKKLKKMPDSKAKQEKLLELNKRKPALVKKKNDAGRKIDVINKQMGAESQLVHKEKLAVTQKKDLIGKARKKTDEAGQIKKEAKEKNRKIIDEKKSKRAEEGELGISVPLTREMAKSLTEQILGASHGGPHPNVPENIKKGQESFKAMDLQQMRDAVEKTLKQMRSRSGAAAQAYTEREKEFQKTGQDLDKNMVDRDVAYDELLWLDSTYNKTVDELGGLMLVEKGQVGFINGANGMLPHVEELNKRVEEKQGKFGKAKTKQDTASGNLAKGSGDTTGIMGKLGGALSSRVLGALSKKEAKEGTEGTGDTAGSAKSIKDFSGNKGEVKNKLDTKKAKDSTSAQGRELQSIHTCLGKTRTKIESAKELGIQELKETLHHKDSDIDNLQEIRTERETHKGTIEKSTNTYWNRMNTLLKIGYSWDEDREVLTHELEMEAHLIHIEEVLKHGGLDKARQEVEDTDNEYLQQKDDELKEDKELAKQEQQSKPQGDDKDGVDTDESPGDENPKVEKNKEDKPKADGPKNDKSGHDKTKADKPKNDKSKDDKPKNNKPKHGKHKVHEPKDDKSGGILAGPDNNDEKLKNPGTPIIENEDAASA